MHHAPLLPRLFAFRLNDEAFSATLAPGTRLLTVLRNDAGLNGPKFGCGYGQCGACSVLVDGKLARSCVLTIAAVEGRDVITLEGLCTRAGPGLVQRAFIEGQGAQCGYCLNGMIMAVHALLLDQPAAGSDTIREALRHTLCRCGTHLEILHSASLAVDALARGEAL